MAVSKRLRYEIFRRDNFQCRYCGKKPPETELRPDHVIPKALGGDDKPDNLVAACVDCNAGKSSIGADSPLVEDVNQQAVRWKRAMEYAAAARRAHWEEREAFADSFAELWGNYGYGKGVNRRTVPLDKEWRATVKRFFDYQMDIDDIYYAIESAMEANHVALENRFRYFCGICWKLLRDQQQAAADILAAEGDA